MQYQTHITATAIHTDKMSVCTAGTGQRNITATTPLHPRGACATPPPEQVKSSNYGSITAAETTGKRTSNEPYAANEGSVQMREFAISGRQQIEADLYCLYDTTKPGLRRVRSLFYP